MEPEKSKISIIVPVYQTRDYLEDCIESVLRQTYPDFELLLVDDGSDDGSGEICDQYAERDNRIRAVHIDNGGVSRARNKGLDLATGELIAFLDSDDKIEPQYLEKLFAWRKEENVPLSICGYRASDKPELLPKRPPSPLMEAGEFLSFALKEANGFLFSVWGSLFPASWDVRFDEEIAYGEDSLFLSCLIKKSGRLVYNPDPLYLYNTGRIGNTVQRRSLKKFRDSLSVWRRMEDIFSGEGAEVRSQFNRIICDMLLKAARQADRERDLSAKKMLLKEARERYQKVKRDSDVPSKDKLRLGLLCLLPSAGADFWEKTHGKQ